MEETALTITRGLTGLIIPVSLVAFALALALIEKSVRRLTRTSAPRLSLSASTDSGSRRAGGSALERICTAISALVALIGVVALVTNAMRGDPISPLHFLAVFGLWLLLSAPALMWRSRWRVPAEGVATIALSVVAVLTGFSIGWVFLPLLVAMVWLCVRHLRSHPLLRVDWEF